MTAVASSPVSGLAGHYPTTLYRGPITNVGADPATIRHITLEQLYDDVQGGRWQTEIAAVRALAAHKKEKGPDGKPTAEAEAYDAAKRKLPFCLASGHYVPGHRHALEPQTGEHGVAYPQCAQGGAYPLIAPSGIRFVELDNINDAQALADARARLQAHPSVVACWRSPGGNGLHVFAVVDPKPTNDAEAHAAYAAVVDELGIASVDDTSVKNLARLAFISHDPDAYWDPSAVPITWEIPEIPQNGASKGGNMAKTAADQPRTGPATGQEPPTEGQQSILLGPDAEKAARLQQAVELIPPPVDYNKWLGWLGCLKAAGISLDEADEWSRRGPNYEEGRVAAKWDGLPARETAAEAVDTIIGYAVNHHGLAPRRGNGPRKAGKAVMSPAPPPPSWDTLTPDYQAGWLAYTAHDALVVVWDPASRERDGKIFYLLYAVSRETGRLDSGELMTHYRAKASDAYLLSVGSNLGAKGQDKEFVACARHAMEMRIARSASTISENVGMSMERYPELWAGIPVHAPIDLDADLSVIGMPSGVWSIPGHRLLTPEEARPKLCATAIRWDYDAAAGHATAAALFETLYGDLVDTTTPPFARWRQAATAMVRPPRQEIIVKISPTASAKTTEGNLQLHAFAPLVVTGRRAAIEQPSGYNAGGSSHNSYLADFARPARRVNVSEVAAGYRLQRELDSQLLRDLSEAATITYRDPGPNLRKTVPYYAHLFLEGNLPKQGQDLLQIADTGNENAKAVMRRLRGAPYIQIPQSQRRPELADYGNPARGGTPEAAADIEAFNATVVRLMCDGMATHWDLLAHGALPEDAHSHQVIDGLQKLGNPEWQVKWLPGVLKTAGPEDETAHNKAIYQSYRDWHEENGEGKAATAKAVLDAIAAYYKVQGRRTSIRIPGGDNPLTVKKYDGWTLTG